MTTPEGGNDLERSVRQRRERVEKARREGERSLAQSLALIGVLGWLIVIPIIAGGLLGRWLDHRFGTGITLTGSFMCAGAVIGGWMAWRRMQEP